MRIYDLCSTSKIIYGDLLRDTMKFDGIQYI
jgi:beta-glucosidase-like glycosyl hydrolase